MDRLQAAFALLLATSLALGGVTAADFGSTLRNVDAIGTVEQQVSVTLVDVTLREESMTVTARLENPTRRSLELDGARFRVHNRSNRRIAAGSGTRVDDNGSSLPAGERLTVTYAIGLSGAQREQVAAAMDRDARLSMNFALRLGDSSFAVRADADITREAS